MVGKVATGVAIASTVWDMGEIVTNNQLTTGQKVLGCGVAVGSFGLGLGVGMLAFTVANLWNPVGWASALLMGVTYLSVATLGGLLVNWAEKEAYRMVGIT